MQNFTGCAGLLSPRLTNCKNTLERETTVNKRRQKYHRSSDGDAISAVTFLIVSFVFAEYVIRVCKDFHF